jgi:hypothetical protein
MNDFGGLNGRGADGEEIFDDWREENSLAFFWN